MDIPFDNVKLFKKYFLLIKVDQNLSDKALSIVKPRPFLKETFMHLFWKLWFNKIFQIFIYKKIIGSKGFKEIATSPLNLNVCWEGREGNLKHKTNIKNNRVFKKRARPELITKLRP